MKLIPKRINPNRLTLWIMFSFVVTLIGVSMNFQAVQSNKGLMPVLVSYNHKWQTDEHFSFNDKEEVKNYYFSDIFSLKISHYDVKYSLGDSFMFLGLIFLTISSTYLILNIKDERRIRKNENKYRRTNKRLV